MAPTSEFRVLADSHHSPGITEANEVKHSLTSGRLSDLPGTT